MTWTSKGYHSVNTYPRTLSWIAVYVGGLALFLILGSLILVSNPIGSTVRGYFNTIDTSQRLDLSLSLDNTTDFHGVDNVDENGTSETSSQVPTSQAGLSSEGIDKNSDEIVLEVLGHGFGYIKGLDYGPKPLSIQKIEHNLATPNLRNELHSMQQKFNDSESQVNDLKNKVEEFKTEVHDIKDQLSQQAESIKKLMAFMEASGKNI